MSKRSKLPQSWAGFETERDERPTGGSSMLAVLVFIFGAVGAGLGLLVYFLLATRLFIFTGATERMMFRFVFGGAALGVGACLYIWFNREP